jgi:hypothetical protein
MICFIPAGAYTTVADADEVTGKGLLLPEVSSCTELTAVSGTSDPF